MREANVKTQTLESNENSEKLWKNAGDKVKKVCLLEMTGHKQGGQGRLQDGVRTKDVMITLWCVRASRCQQFRKDLNKKSCFG